MDLISEEFQLKMAGKNKYFDNFTTKEHGVIDGPSIIAGAKTETIS